MSSYEIPEDLRYLIPKRGKCTEKYEIHRSDIEKNDDLTARLEKLEKLTKELFYIQGGQDTYHTYLKDGKTVPGFCLFIGREQRWGFEEGDFIITERGYIYDQETCIKLAGLISSLIQTVNNMNASTDSPVTQANKRIVAQLYRTLSDSNRCQYDSLGRVLKEKQKDSPEIVKAAQEILNVLKYLDPTDCRNRDPQKGIINFSIANIESLYQEIERIKEWDLNARFQGDDHDALIEYTENLLFAMKTPMRDTANLDETTKRIILWRTYNAIYNPSEQTINSLAKIANQVEGAPDYSKRLVIALKVLAKFLLGIYLRKSATSFEEDKHEWKEAGRKGDSAKIDELAKHLKEMEYKSKGRGFFKKKEDAPPENKDSSSLKSQGKR